MDEQRGERLPRLVKVMRDLLAPDGCDWDKAQDFLSLRPYVVEEAFEVVDAIDRQSPELLKEELGDLLLQIVFLGELAQRAGWFGHDDIVDGVCDKLVRRHPHVFGGETAVGASSALANWERLKKKEKAGRGALDGVPAAMPALLRAVRVGEKASAVGYDWPDVDGAREKVTEELQELDAALDGADDAAAEAELGDVLFALASLGRKRGIDPEAALRGTLDRFSRRFGHAEAAARADGKGLDELDPAALDVLWEAAKAAPPEGL